MAAHCVLVPTEVLHVTAMIAQSVSIDVRQMSQLLCPFDR